MLAKDVAMTDWLESLPGLRSPRTIKDERSLSVLNYSTDNSLYYLNSKRRLEANTGEIGAFIQMDKKM